MTSMAVSECVYSIKAEFRVFSSGWRPLELEWPALFPSSIWNETLIDQLRT